MRFDYYFHAIRFSWMNMTISQLEIESGEEQGNETEVAGSLTCGNCGFESENEDRYAYHVKLCAIPA